MKPNKIKVIVCPENDIRRRIMQKVVQECGLALTASDASKLIKPTVYDYNLITSYFVVADMHNFRQSPLTNQKLYELAASGIAVIVGVRKLPPEFEFISETYYSNYL